MKFFRIALVITIFLKSSLASTAQTYQRTEFGVKATIGSLEVELQFYNPSIVRILKHPTGKLFTKQSLSVVLAPEKTSFSLKQQGDELSLKSEKIQVLLNLKTGVFSFATKETPLLREKELGASFTDFNDAGEKTFTVSQSFILDKDEFIWGSNSKVKCRSGMLNSI